MDKEYVAHKVVTTGTYPSTYMNTVKEGGLSLPRSCEGGATALLAPPPPLPPPSPCGMNTIPLDNLCYLLSPLFTYYLYH